jgi:hypothetical protein
MTQAHNSIPSLILKGLLAGVVCLIATMLTGMVLSALHIPLIDATPPGTDPRKSLYYFLIVAPWLGPALVPLARFTGGSRLLRGLAFSFLMFVCMGVNTILEARIFLTIYSHGGALASILAVLPPALLSGLALSYLLPQAQPEMSASVKWRCFFATRTPFSWTARFLLAILAFAVAYFVFGLMVAPFVVPYYRAGILGLTLPPFSVMLPVLFVRSTLFLLACLPFLVLWTRSRLSLILSLGFAHWSLTGLLGMILVFFWPAAMRIGHGLEIGADSFAYSTALVFLLVPRQREDTLPTSAHVAPMLPS